MYKAIINVKSNKCAKYYTNNSTYPACTTLADNFSIHE